MQALTIFDSNHAFLADFFHGLSNDLAHGGISVGGNCSDLRDFRVGRAWLGNFFELLDDRGDCHVDAALQIHRIHSSHNELHSFANNRLCKHGGGGGTISSHVRRFAGDLLCHLRAHILKLVFKFDLFRYNDPRAGDERRTIGTFENNVATLRTEGHFDHIRQDIYTFHDPGTGGFMKQNLFCRHGASRTNFARPGQVSTRLYISPAPAQSIHRNRLFRRGGPESRCHMQLSLFTEVGGD